MVVVVVCGTVAEISGRLIMCAGILLRAGMASAQWRVGTILDWLGRWALRHDDVWTVVRVALSGPRWTVDAADPVDRRGARAEPAKHTTHTRFRAFRGGWGCFSF